MDIAKRQSFKQVRADQRNTIAIMHTRVFSASRGGGNPCPVVPTADDLDDADMQALARRFGLDTVFILEPQSEQADIRLRYFVPEHEMGVSGHATIAAITVALREGRIKANCVRVQTLNGLFVVTCTNNGRQLLVTLDQNPPTFGPSVPVAIVAKALRIHENDIVDETPVESVSVSRAKLLVRVTDFRVLNALDPDFNALWSLCDRFGVTGVYVFTTKTDKPHADAEARQYPLRAGFPEDAATGVAAAALGAYLVRYDQDCRQGEHLIRIAQGYAMGAPSRIETIVECERGKIARTAVRGSAEIVRRECIARTELTPAI